jgi:UDP:flavonoid glycosyltransferase YjiC (YdhE family)
MKILVITMGSRGDVNPFLQLAMKLKDAGHDVVLCASDNFRTLIVGQGFKFKPHLSQEEYETLMSDTDLWHPQKALPTFMKKGLLPATRKIYPLIMQERSNDFLVVAPATALAAKLAAEKEGIKLVQLHLAPCMFRTLQDTAQIGTVPMGDNLPAWYKKLVWWTIDTFIFGPCIKKELNRFRQEIGLKPMSRIPYNWIFSSCLNAAVFSRHIAPQQPDWPMPSEVFDFLLYDGDEQVTPEAEKFLSQGEPPIIFTFGTAFYFAKGDFIESMKALEMLNARGIFLAPKTENLPERLPATIRAFPFLPLGKILPSCRAIVHHGGIGTLGQALKSGVPQLIRPLAFDQFDNAYRIAKRQLGSYLLARQYKAENIYQKLHAMLDDTAVAANCRNFARSIDSEKTLEKLVSAIEEIGRRG